jgi:L-threonylcarbamoyladenylate synthase
MFASDLDENAKVGASLSLAVEYLRQGKIVGFPTETYYGLAVDPENTVAVDRLFELKKRVASKAVLLLVENEKQLSAVVSTVPAVYLPLMEKFWPGPLTLIFPAQENINRKITANTGTVGIRISPHHIAQELVSAFGRPITATSANISGKEPAGSARQVLNYFGDKIDYILEGKTTSSKGASTIVGYENGKLTLLRRGVIDIGSL